MQIPLTIQEWIGERSFSVDTIGMSDSTVICFEDMVLKMEKQGEESDKEHAMMRWLTGKLPVPQVFCTATEEGTNYLLMSRVPGEMSCAPEYLENPREMVRLLAEGLRMLWHIDVTDCPYDHSIENKLRLAARRVAEYPEIPDNADPETFGEGGFSSPAHLLQWLQENKPEEDLVFSHGDYCLPNIFLRDGEISGFIDLGRSGVADRYQDIALCYRSLKHNFDGTYGGKIYPDFRPELLFEELDMEPDWEKVRYYILLDELF